MRSFEEVSNNSLEKLDLYVPVVERVHGGSHPEFYQVSKLFKEIEGKIRTEGLDKSNLDKEFEELVRLTSNYRIPEDVCETYEAVYHMLEEWDKSYKRMK